MAANDCHNWERWLWTTKLYITTTISITIAVYNEWWARMVGSRHCISQGEFFFFAFLALFLLKWYLQLDPPLSRQMPNFHTQTRTNGARDATHLECKGMFFFLFLFFCFFFFFSHPTKFFYRSHQSTQQVPPRPPYPPPQHFQKTPKWPPPPRLTMEMVVL